MFHGWNVIIARGTSNLISFTSLIVSDCDVTFLSSQMFELFLTYLKKFTYTLYNVTWFIVARRYFGLPARNIYFSICEYIIRVYMVYTRAVYSGVLEQLCKFSFAHFNVYKIGFHRHHKEFNMRFQQSSSEIKSVVNIYIRNI